MPLGRCGPGEASDCCARARFPPTRGKLQHQPDGFGRNLKLGVCRSALLRVGARHPAPAIRCYGLRPASPPACAAPIGWARPAPRGSRAPAVGARERSREGRGHPAGPPGARRATALRQGGPERVGARADSSAHPRTPILPQGGLLRPSSATRWAWRRTRQRGGPSPKPARRASRRGSAGTDRRVAAVTGGVGGRRAPPPTLRLGLATRR